MSGKMRCAPLPAEPLRLENALLEVRGSPDRIRKAHSVCSKVLFLPCLAAATPPCTPCTNTLQATVPYLPSHLQLPTALLYLTPGRLFSNFFWQLHLFETLESYQGEAWLQLPVTSAGSVLLCPVPGSAPLQEPTGSPSPSWAGAPAPPAPAQLHLGNSVFQGSRACTVTALQHLPAFTKSQSSLNSDAGYRAPLHSFGEESSKIFYFTLVFMITHDKGSKRYIFHPLMLPHAFSS